MGWQQGVHATLHKNPQSEELCIPKYCAAGDNYTGQDKEAPDMRVYSYAPSNKPRDAHRLP